MSSTKSICLEIIKLKGNYVAASRVIIFEFGVLHPESLLLVLIHFEVAPLLFVDPVDLILQVGQLDAVGRGVHHFRDDSLTQNSKSKTLSYRTRLGSLP